MKVKVSEASGIVLDWLVATAEKPVGGYKAWVQVNLDRGLVPAGVHADDWLTGGPIIERERISIDLFRDGWYAVRGAQEDHYYRDTPQAAGPTALVAAMRCYVASRLGEEVEVPDELA